MIEWKPVLGYELLYEISNTGLLKGIKRNKILTPFKDKDGYSKITLSNRRIKKCTSIHRLVALSFIPNPKGRDMINHIDGDVNNNNSENLEWCNNSENQIHALKIGLLKRKYGRDNPAYGKPSKQAIKVICTVTGNKFRRIQDAADSIGMKYERLRRKLHGQSKNNTTLIIDLHIADELFSHAPETCEA